MMLWCPAEDHATDEIDKSKLPLNAEENVVHSALERSRRIAKTEGQSSKLV